MFKKLLPKELGFHCVKGGIFQHWGKYIRFTKILGTVGSDMIPPEFYNMPIYVEFIESHI